MHPPITLVSGLLRSLPYAVPFIKHSEDSEKIKPTKVMGNDALHTIWCSWPPLLCLFTAPHGSDSRQVIKRTP